MSKAKVADAATPAPVIVPTGIQAVAYMRDLVARHAQDKHAPGVSAQATPVAAVARPAHVVVPQAVARVAQAQSHDTPPTPAVIPDQPVTAPDMQELPPALLDELVAAISEVLARYEGKLPPRAAAKPAAPRRVTALPGGPGVVIDYAAVERYPDGSHAPTPCLGGCGTEMSKGFRCRACKAVRRATRVGEEVEA